MIAGKKYDYEITVKYGYNNDDPLIKEIHAAYEHLISLVEQNGIAASNITKNLPSGKGMKDWGEVKKRLCDRWDSCSPCQYSGGPSRTHGGLECRHPLNPNNEKASK